MNIKGIESKMLELGLDVDGTAILDYCEEYVYCNGDVMTTSYRITDELYNDNDKVIKVVYYVDVDYSFYDDDCSEVESFDLTVTDIELF